MFENIVFVLFQDAYKMFENRQLLDVLGLFVVLPILAFPVISFIKWYIKWSATRPTQAPPQTASDAYFNAQILSTLAQMSSSQGRMEAMLTELIRRRDNDKPFGEPR